MNLTALFNTITVGGIVIVALSANLAWTTRVIIGVILIVLGLLFGAGVVH